MADIRFEIPDDMISGWACQTIDGVATGNVGAMERF
jgi:hypothetical protein